MLGLAARNFADSNNIIWPPTMQVRSRLPIPLKFRLFVVVIVGLLMAGHITGCEMVSQEDSSAAAFEQGDAEVKWRGLGFKTGALAVLGADNELLLQFSDPDDAIYLDINGLTQADLYFEPIAIESDRRFTVSLVNKVGEHLLALHYQPLNEQTYNISYEAGTLSTDVIDIQCRLNGETRYQKSVNLTEEQDFPPTATTTSEPTSIHYRKSEDGTVLISFDYESSVDTNGFALLTFSSGTTAYCSHIDFLPQTEGFEDDIPSQRPQGLHLSGIDDIRFVDGYFE